VLTPVLFLDVDGVLNPYGAENYSDHYTAYDLFPGEEPVHVSWTHTDLIHRLATAFEIVWATAWNEEANTVLAPLLGIAPLPVAIMPKIPFEPRDKVLAVSAYAQDRPAVWIDDLHTPEGRAWAAARTAPTLLISVTASTGLNADHAEEALGWVGNLNR